MAGHLPGFVGREAELKQLERSLRDVQSSGTGRALAVRGRRAVGKSTLVEELLMRKRPPHAFFAAAKDQPSAEALHGFLTELQGSTLPVAAQLAEGLRPQSWEAALRLLAGSFAAAHGEGIKGPFCLVIDELPWLAEQEPSIEGLLQSVWDRRLRRLPVLLILIGSDQHMMERLERYDRPLHGRVQPMLLAPLNPAETAAMIGADAKTALDAYCILGGFPQLAATWRASDTAKRYLGRELADPTSPLIVTGERMLASELPPHSSPAAVLSAIGAGEVEFSRILNRSGVGRTSLTASLQALAEKRIIDRQTPIAQGRLGKISRYTVADPYLRFWLRFIAPNLPLIERRRGDLALQRVVEGWSAFRGHAVEPVVRACVERMLPDERFGDARFVSGYWTRTNDVEVDLVGVDDDHRPAVASFVGEIKWREQAPFSRQDTAALSAARPRVPCTAPDTLLLGVSLSGFSAGCKLDVQLGPEDLLAAWGPS
jgi:AAA+ ATPase superfamily predicted ATPase